MSVSFDWPAPHPPELLGRPSRKAATAALEAHVEVLEGEPLRLALSRALKKAENLGGQERRFAALATRELSRHTRLLDLAARLLGQRPGKNLLREDQALLRYTLWRRLYCGASWAQLAAEVRLPGPIRPRVVKDDVLERMASAPLPPPEADDEAAALATLHSFPSWLASGLAAVAPPGELGPLLAALNREPPLQLRVRPGLSPAEAEARLAAEGVRVRAVEGVPQALVVADVGHRVFETALLKKGALQVQDVGSQLISALCGRPEELAGRTTADVCAGAGGKTVVLADAVGQGGRVLAGDTSRRRLADARERVRELGLRQVSFPHPLPLGEVDVALVDAPCSGSGSLSREPDAKWRLTPQKVAEFAALQRRLLEETADALRPGAVLVYATCSLLREEDEAVVEAFLAARPGFVLEPASPWVDARFTEGPYLRVWPHRSEGGGFFAARLRRV